MIFAVCFAYVLVVTELLCVLCVCVKLHGADKTGNTFVTRVVKVSEKEYAECITEQPCTGDDFRDLLPCLAEQELEDIDLAELTPCQEEVEIEDRIQCFTPEISSSTDSDTVSFDFSLDPSVDVESYGAPELEFEEAAAPVPSSKRSSLIRVLRQTFSTKRYPIVFPDGYTVPGEVVSSGYKRAVLKTVLKGYHPKNYYCRGLKQSRFDKF